MTNILGKNAGNSNFTIASTQKYLRITLTEQVEDVHNRNSKILKTETEEDIGRWKDCLVLMDSRVNIVNTEIDRTQEPALPLLGTYPEDSPCCHKDTCLTVLIAALFITAPNWKYLNVRQLMNTS